MLDFIKAEKQLSVEQLLEKLKYGKAQKRTIEITAYRLRQKGLIDSIITLVEGEVSKEVRELTQSSEALKAWTRRLNSQETINKFLYLYLRYFGWIKQKGCYQTPDEMIEHQQNAESNKERFKDITLIEDYLLESKLPAPQQKSTYTAIRSFYKHNKAALPAYPIQFKTKNNKPKVTEEPITLPEIKELLKNANPREQGIFLCCLHAGLDRSTFCKVFNLNAWPQIVKQMGTENADDWDLSKAPVKIELLRPKTQQEYYSFLSVDALKAIQAWLKVRETLTGKKMSAGEPLFLTARREPMQVDNVSGLFNRLAISAGLEAKKYGKAVRG